MPVVNGTSSVRVRFTDRKVENNPPVDAASGDLKLVVLDLIASGFTHVTNGLRLARNRMTREQMRALLGTEEPSRLRGADHIQKER